MHIAELFTSLIGKNTIYPGKNTYSNLLYITKSKTCQNLLWVVENVILIRYYYQTAKTKALYESIDGHTGRPADNPPNSDGLGVYHRTIPELTVRVYSQPGPPISQWFRLDANPDTKSLSLTVF